MILSVWSNWLLTLLTVGVIYVLLPFNIHHIGEEAYGSWVLITSITGYLQLLTLGAPMAALRYIARYAAEKDEAKLNQAVGTFAGLFLMAGAVSLLIGLALLLVFNLIWHVPPEMLGEVRWTFGLVVLCVSAGFIQLLPYGIMAAHHDFGLRNSIMGGAAILRLVLTMLLVKLYPHISALGLATLGILLFEMSISWVIVRRRYPNIHISLSHFDWTMLKNILAFSLFVLVLNMGSQLSYQTDSLVIGGFRPLSDIPQYTVANTLTLYLVEFVAAIAVVVMPTATRLHTAHDMNGLRVIFLKWSKITFSLTLLSGTFILVLGPRFLAWWLGADFEGPAGEVLRILMLSYLVFLPVRGVAQPILMGIGKPKLPSIAFVIAGLLNLLLSLWWVRDYGLAGVAWGTAVPNILLAFAMLYFTCKELELSLGTYFSQVIWRPMVGSIPGFALLYWALNTFDVSGLLHLVTWGLALVAVFGVVWLGFVYEGDPHVDLKGWIRQRLPQGARKA